MLIGLMMSTWMLSMWISNTATVTMMLPIAEAVMVQLEQLFIHVHKLKVCIIISTLFKRTLYCLNNAGNAFKKYYFIVKSQIHLS